MTLTNNNDFCPYCSDNNNTVYHSGQCPRIKAIEYYPDGSIKRIEFVTQSNQHGNVNRADFVTQPNPFGSNPLGPTIWTERTSASSFTRFTSKITDD